MVEVSRAGSILPYCEDEPKPTNSLPTNVAFVTCRLTHVYQNGCAPYYTILSKGTEEASSSPASREETAAAMTRLELAWLEVKAAASRALLRHGCTATHHHAVGRLHRPHYERERG